MDVQRETARAEREGAPVRDLQLALLDGDERPVGPLLGSVYQGLNGDLLNAVAPLYLGGSVLDVTYGKGAWWTRFKPDPFAFHDLELDGVDFRSLPYADASWDAVCFDPPYVPRQGPKDAKRAREQVFRSAYGLRESRSGTELRALIFDGLAECARVAGRWLLVKCNDYTNARAFTLGHYLVLKQAEDLGIRCHDLIVHYSGPGPGGQQILTPLRARRHHSYLLVFDTRPMHRARAKREGAGDPSGHFGRHLSPHGDAP